MRNLFKLLFSRVVVVTLLILLQIAELFVVLLYLRDYWTWFNAALSVLSIVLLLRIVSDRTDATYKLAWIVPILAFPLFGICLYLLFGGMRLTRRNRNRLQHLNRALQKALPGDADTDAALAAVSPLAAKQSAYLEKISYSPLCRSTDTVYYRLADDAFPAMLEAMRGAKRYLFLEYFIISPGSMLDEILAVLREKAAEGVDIRILYDDFGCIRSLPMRFRKEMAAMGIRAVAFNRYVPILSARLNNRDHRKCLIADGQTAFTGGANLADEYINRKERFGHWKDSVLRVDGAAAWNITAQFLAMWNYATGEDGDLLSFRPAQTVRKDTAGFVQPFTDSPLDFDRVSSNTFLRMIAAAKQSLFIMTPYLILNRSIEDALCTAALSGVDVRIITPHIPDKRYVHGLTRANYEVLMEYGVKIYEYTPGFIHSKVFLVDDEAAVVGTINMDFRSLYLNFENGVWLYGTESIRTIREDFAQTLALSEQVTEETSQNRNRLVRLYRSVLRILAPLM